MYWTDLTVSDKVLCEVGRIAIFQTHIEQTMASCIRLLLGLDEESANLVTYRLTFWRLLDTLESLLHNCSDTPAGQIKRFGNFKKEMKDIVPQRNSCVHSMWSFSDAENAAIRITYSKDKQTKKISRSVNTISLDELKIISEKFKDANWLIGDIRAKVWENKSGRLSAVE